MKVWFIKSYRGPEVLEFGHLPEPVLGPCDALTDIRAACVNRIDIRVGKDELKRLAPYTFPVRIGTDPAGVLTALGADVGRFAVIRHATLGRHRSPAGLARSLYAAHSLARNGSGFFCVLRGIRSAGQSSVVAKPS